jgi:hypothetical protein
MNTLIETIKHAGHTIEIHYDVNPFSPRIWDNLGTIIYSASDYVLGDIECDIDDHLYGLCTDIHPDFPEEQFEEHGWKILEKYYHILSVYAYIHGAATIRTGSFSCSWDSGQSGFIYCLKETMRKEIGNYSEERGDEALRQEIKTYDGYLTGQTYGYVVKDQDGDTIESCYGFIGESGKDYMINEAKSAAEFNQEKVEKLESETALASVWP